MNFSDKFVCVLLSLMLVIIAKTLLSIGTALEGNSPERFALSFKAAFGFQKLEFP